MFLSFFCGLRQDMSMRDQKMSPGPKASAKFGDRIAAWTSARWVPDR